MALSTTKLINTYVRVRRDEAKSSTFPASHYIWQLILESLSQHEQEVYHYLERKGELTAQAIADKFHLSINHAFNIVRHLERYGVVTRRVNPANPYREYLWSVAAESNGSQVRE
jgi:DNA-binding MarR family transcriptional regulator